MSRVVFAGGLVYDGSLAEPFEADVVVEGGLVVDVGRGLDGDDSVDCAGAFVAPGFFDTHVHVTLDNPGPMHIIETPFSLQFFTAAANLRKTLLGGITFVRDAAGADLGIKVALARGLIPGPRMQIAVTMLSQTGGHGDPWHVCGGDVPFIVPHPGRPDGVVDGVEQVRRRVREIIRAGADVIKVATTGGVLSSRDDPSHAHFRDDELAVMVAEASAAGLAVMAHAQGAEGVKAAVRNGARSIEHGVFLDDEAIELMLANGTWLVPTLHAVQSLLTAIDESDTYPQAIVDKVHLVAASHQDSIARAHSAGVKIAMGTDCGVGPHGTNLEELELMHKAGLSALEALHATTGSAAELLRVDSTVGRIAPGMRADLVVVDGSPGDVRELTERLRGVYLDGLAVERS
jgi:imidazolonepropionase-like amidohydrolase